ncbi:MAG TPA: hypothetical protein VLB07_00070 [Woeseiaceae bacterium]|nr:hypothetical protein [Woeseiaceae bacterium]
MSRLQGIPKTWFPATLLLSLYVYWHVTWAFSLQFEPALFLPLFTGWLAHRFGARIIGLVLFLGLLSALTIHVQLFDTLSIGFGISLGIYLVSLCAAVAFCRPAIECNLDRILNKRWRWIRWLLLVAFWPAVFMPRSISFELTDTLQIGTNPGFVLLAILLAACIRWQALIDEFDSRVFAVPQKAVNGVRLAILMLLALAVLANAEWSGDYGFSLSFGFTDGLGVLLALAFVVTATGAVDWRLTLLFLVLFLASEGPVEWLVDTIKAAIPEPPAVPDSSGAAGDEFALEEIVVAGVSIRQSMFWSDLVNGASLVLLAAGIVPFMQQRVTDKLMSRRTAVFLALALMVLLVGMPLAHSGVGGFGYFIIGGIAFVVGLRWSIKGIVLAPLIIQLSYLLAIALVTTDYRDGPGALDVVNIGLLAFPFAYFGMLSRRLSPVGGDLS